MHEVVARAVARDAFEQGIGVFAEVRRHAVLFEAGVASREVDHTGVLVEVEYFRAAEVMAASVDVNLDALVGEDRSDAA